MNTGMRLHRLRLAAAGLFVSGAALFAPFSHAADSSVYGPLAANAVQGGTLNLGSLTEPPGLDPYHQGSDARIRFTVLMYQGLFYEGADGQAHPLLAESYQTSPDGLTYTIKIRSGVKFHTGAAMTAKDVAYSYNYLRDPKNGSPGASELSQITSIEAVDDSTLKIVLSKPSAALPMTLGNRYGGVVPANYFDKADAGQALNRASVGTGPFKLAEFRPNSNMVLVRNTDYWEKGAPYLDRIAVTFVPNSSSLIVALRNKRVDLALLSRPQDITQVEKLPELTVKRWPSLSQKAIDLGSELKPLDDVRVRQAIALAVDRDEIMKASVGQYGRVAVTMVAGMQDEWGADPASVPNAKVDIEAAKKLMKEAGFEKGMNLTLTTINSYDWMDPAAVTLKQQLARIGINLNIQRVDLGVWIKNFQSKQMGFTFNDWSTQPDPDLLFYRHFHKAPEGADFRNWNDATASALLDKGRSESDPAKRKAIYVEFQKRMAETVPTVMLFSADFVTVANANVQNYVQHPSGWYYGLARAWIKK
ncbi:MAG: transporter substrate-binding protein [Rhizobacter sp.]|nr:transporter substrate-binding protein [Rhizobacter sp.]